MRGSCHAARYAEAVFHRMKCTVWSGPPHPGYCCHTWNDDNLIDYHAHGNYHAQSAPSCPGYVTVAPATTKPGTTRVAQHDPETGTAPLSETVPDFTMGRHRGLQHFQLHVGIFPECPVSRRGPHSVRGLPLLVRAPRLQYRSRLDRLLSSRTPLRFVSKFICERISGSSVSRLCQTLLRPRQGGIQSIRCTTVHCPRRRM